MGWIGIGGVGGGPDGCATCDSWRKAVRQMAESFASVGGGGHGLWCGSVLLSSRRGGGERGGGRVLRGLEGGVRGLEGGVMGMGVVGMGRNRFDAGLGMLSVLRLVLGCWFAPKIIWKDGGCRTDSLLRLEMRI